MAELVQEYRTRAGSARELVDEVEAAVASGALEPGRELPSVRSLAREAGVSPATIAAGLAELRRRGVIVTERRRGSRVADGPYAGALSRPLPVPAGARDLSSGNPDPALLPDLGAALGALGGHGRLYGQPPELPELIEAAREQLRGDGLPEGEMCVVSGAMDGIERVLAARLRPGDRVAVESPGYADLFELLRARGMGLEPVAVDERGMRPEQLREALARGARAVVVTPRGQNPTGAALDGERAADLAGVLAEFPETLVVEDDHLGPVAGCELHTLLDGRGAWAAARSVAKALGPDLRLAVLAGDASTIGRVRAGQSCGPGWVSHILQRAVLALWRDEQAGALVALAGVRYAERRSGLIEALREEGVRAEAASGLNVWVPVAEEAATTAALLARGWVVAPGSRYRLGADPSAIRVTISTLEPEQARRFAGDLAEVLAPQAVRRHG